jgi:transcriptional regulator with PAS, ATPase and Fis domain
MELKFKISEVAKFNTDVLILGETGTGKELFAHAIHQLSGREGNFAAINCSAIPKDLFESELFGHKKGAFSGAYLDKQGAFEYANRGTLFLDEIGEMPLEMQAKILRAVEYRTITRLGNMNPLSLDLRIVFATNRDLKKEVDEGRFRKDLFFRIFSPSFRIIPLRERTEDIPLLAEHFLNVCNERFQKKVMSVSPSLMKMFRNYTWDGNVRELMKVIEMGVINATDSIITEKEISCFTDNLKNGREVKDDDLPPASKVTDEDVRYWMEKLNYNKSKVARRLGVSYRTILRRSKLMGQ